MKIVTFRYRLHTWIIRQHVLIHNTTRNIFREVGFIAKPSVDYMYNIIRTPLQNPVDLEVVGFQAPLHLTDSVQLGMHTALCPEYKTVVNKHIVYLPVYGTKFQASNGYMYVDTIF
jgi:hypothetical protein